MVLFGHMSGLLHSETIWLSPTPEKPSKGWDAGSIRILTVAVLKHKSSKRRILACATHLDNEGSKSRENSVTIILDTLKRVHKQWSNDSTLPIVLAGDFNSFTDQEAYLGMAQSDFMYDLYKYVPSKRRYGEENTFTGFQPEKDKDEQGRIDFIWLGPKDSVYKDAADSTLQGLWKVDGRPKTLSEVTAQDNTIQILSRTLQSTNLPHMLFYGPPGTGKTSTILALAKQLYGPELMKSRVLELNASDERGISIVRQKVKDFARQQLSSAPTHNVMTEDKDSPEGTKMVRYRDKYPCPPFKIIVLDEADSMTQDAQSALRRTMETYSRMTRFCLVCNYVTRIIDPLASRCSKFRFKSLDQGNAVKRVDDIARLEHVQLDPGVSEELVRVADGDLRKAITFLQSAARLVGAMQTPREPTSRKRKRAVDAAAADDEMDVDSDTTLVDTPDTTHTVSLQAIAEIAGVIPASTLTTLSDSLFPTSSARSIRYSEIARVVQNMVAEGWSATQTLSQLYEAVMFDERVADVKKVRLAGVFSETDKRLVDESMVEIECM
ncbi:nuclear protein localization protein 4 [Ascochyta clinopodiicola]|nr:nuclear protein localization protein 4 [Ascochyta clinopodiicola]